MRNRSMVLDDWYCRLEPSPISGIGVFAIKRILHGINPFKDQTNSSFRFSKRDLEKLSPLQASTLCYLNGVNDINDIWIPSYGMNIVSLACYINHSVNPNIHTCNGGHTFITSREIYIGEEITADYYSFGMGNLL